MSQIPAFQFFNLTDGTRVEGNYMISSLSEAFMPVSTFHEPVFTFKNLTNGNRAKAIIFVDVDGNLITL